MEAAKPGEILVSDRTLQALDAATVTARKRRFSAKGVPADLGAHVVERPPDQLRATHGGHRSHDRPSSRSRHQATKSAWYAKTTPASGNQQFDQ